MPVARCLRYLSAKVLFLGPGGIRELRRMAWCEPRSGTAQDDAYPQPHRNRTVAISRAQRRMFGGRERKFEGQLTARLIAGAHLRYVTRKGL